MASRFTTFSSRNDRFGVVYLLSFLAIFALLEPSGFVEMPNLTRVDTILTAVKYGLFIFGFVCMALQCLRRDLVASSLGLFFIVLTIATLVPSSKGSSRVLFGEFGMWLVTYGVMAYCMTRAPEEALRSASTALLILICINCITVIMFPSNSGAALNIGESGQPHWFLGHKNLFINYMLLGLLISVLNDIVNECTCSIKTATMVVASLIALTLSYSATSVVVYVTFCILIICGRRQWRSILNGRTIAIVSMLLLVFVVILRLQDYVAWFITGVLGKDLTFTGRTIIWDQEIDAIRSNFLLGVGVNSYQVIGFLYNGAINHGHCFYLYIAYQGGIFALLLFFITCLLAICRLERRKGDFGSRAIYAGLSCYLLMLVFDYTYLPALPAILCLATTYKVENIRTRK